MTNKPKLNFVKGILEPLLLTVLLLAGLIAGVLGVYDELCLSTCSEKNSTSNLVKTEVISSDELYETNLITQESESANLSGGMVLGIGGVDGSYTKESDLVYVWTQHTDKGRKIRYAKVTDEDCPGYELIPDGETPHIDTLQSTYEVTSPVFKRKRNVTSNEYQILYVPESCVNYNFKIDVTKDM